MMRVSTRSRIDGSANPGLAKPDAFAYPIEYVKPVR
jgi:hypothetical protein